MWYEVKVLPSNVFALYVQCWQFIRSALLIKILHKSASYALEVVERSNRQLLPRINASCELRESECDTIANTITPIGHNRQDFVIILS